MSLVKPSTKVGYTGVVDVIFSWSEVKLPLPGPPHMPPPLTLCQQGLASFKKCQRHLPKKVLCLYKTVHFNNHEIMTENEYSDIISMFINYLPFWSILHLKNSRKCFWMHLMSNNLKLQISRHLELFGTMDMTFAHTLQVVLCIAPRLMTTKKLCPSRCMICKGYVRDSNGIDVLHFPRRGLGPQQLYWKCSSSGLPNSVYTYSTVQIQWNQNL